MGSDSVKVEILKNILTILMLFFLQREYFLEDYLSGQKGAHCRVGLPLIVIGTPDRGQQINEHKSKSSKGDS